MTTEVKRWNRRSFVRRLLRLSAAAGVAGAVSANSPVNPWLLPDVAAVSGIGTSGQLAFWIDNSGSLAGFGHWDTPNSKLALGDSSNVANGSFATVGGGLQNVAGGDYSTVGGGNSNATSGYATTVGGGNSNAAIGIEATVGGGGFNVADGNDATVGGGYDNIASGNYATIGGGLSNIAGYDYATVAGGYSGSATDYAATVGGGYDNLADGMYSTVGGGYGNRASVAASTVGGGGINVAGSNYATVPGGFHNAAEAEYSLAAGSYAKVSGAHHGAMLFSDDSYALSGIAFNSVVADEFAVRATGGFRFVTGINVSGNVTRLVAVNSSGNLGVGTGSPSYAVDLRTSGSASSQMHISPTGTDSGGYLTSANAGNLFMAGGAAWNGSAWVAKSSTSYQYGGGVAGVRFFFDTGLTVGGTYTPTTRMFIGPTGHVGIGMSTAPAHLLQLGLDDAAKPSTSTWTIASDARLKDPGSIEPFTEGSQFIKRLPQPVWFRYRKESGLPSDQTVVGWVAQDIAPVAPFMVRRTKQKLSLTDEEETETFSLNTNELPYAIVNSVREILERLEQIEKKLERMRN